MSVEFDALKASVAALEGTEQKAIALLGDLKSKLDAALAGGNLAADIAALSTQLGQDNASLAAAVAAATPADAAPATPAA